MVAKLRPHKAIAFTYVVYIIAISSQASVHINCFACKGWFVSEFFNEWHYRHKASRLVHSTNVTASVAEWLRAWDTLTMFEATVCGRS